MAAYRSEQGNFIKVPTKFEVSPTSETGTNWALSEEFYTPCLFTYFEYGSGTDLLLNARVTKYASLHLTLVVAFNYYLAN